MNPMKQEQFEQVKTTLKKVPFWKAGTFGLNCIRQEYAVYEILAKDRCFDITKFLKKTVERFFKALATGYAMDEQYLLAIEESFFEPRDEWEKLALQVVQDLCDYFYAVHEKKPATAIAMQERQILFIESYKSALGEMDSEKESMISDLLTRTYKQHMNWATELAELSNKEKKTYLAKLQEESLPSLLGDDILKHRPAIIPEKPTKKKLPEIRVVSLDFEQDAKEPYSKWIVNASMEQLYLHTWEEIEPEKAELIIKREKEVSPVDVPGGMFAINYLRKDYVDICHNMELSARLFAQDICVLTRDYDRVRGFWYMSALAGLSTIQLLEKGYPPKNGNIQHSLSKKASKDSLLFYACINAYTAGADDLVKEFHLVAGNQLDLKTLVDILEMKSGEELQKQVSSWEDEELRDCITAILQEDEKALRKGILHMIRHDRKQHDMYRIMVEPRAYACLRLAKERGMKLAPVVAVEVLEGKLDLPPVDRQKYKIPYQEEIEGLVK